VYLSAVIVPPLPQREEVGRLLADVHARMVGPTTGGRTEGGRIRWGRSRPASAPSAGSPLTPLPVGLMTIHVTRFGFVDPAAGDRLRATLERDARGWTAPTVRVGGTLSTHGSDERLHLALEGEVDGLRAIFREITESARRAGFMLDRRSFQPSLPVAELDESVSDDALATLVAGLEALAGTPWQVQDVVLARIGFGSGDDSLQPVGTIPIGESAG
jgi:2'-5' RNA ligase